jgi:hypothetical protein
MWLKRWNLPDVVVLLSDGVGHHQPLDLRLAEQLLRNLRMVLACKMS